MRSEQAKIVSFNDLRSRGRASRVSSSGNRTSSRSSSSRLGSSSQQIDPRNFSARNTHRSFPDASAKRQGSPTYSHGSSAYRQGGSVYQQGRPARHGATYLGVAAPVSQSFVSPRRSNRGVQDRYRDEGVQQRARHANRTEQASSQDASADATFIQNAKKRLRSAKAERQFNKRFASNGSRSEEQTSRPALYEMRMGKTHAHSARMQQEANSSAKNPFSRFSLPVLFSGKGAVIGPRLIAVACCILFATVMLYQPLSDYYIESRHLQQLEAEYSALEEQNASLQSEVDYLNTNEGLEDYARYKLGYVRADEQIATVENIDSPTINDSSDSVTYTIPSGSISAPDTWYSGVLDVVFGYGS